MNKLLFLIPLFSIACAHRPKVAPSPLFAYGTYRHEVHVQVGDKAFDITGVNKWAPDRFQLVALGPMDSTLFRYTKDLATGAEDIYVRQETLGIDAQQLGRIMQGLLKIYGLDTGICDGPKCRTTLGGHQIDLFLDGSRRVSRMSVQEQRFRISIDIKDFRQE